MHTATAGDAKKSPLSRLLARLGGAPARTSVSEETVADTSIIDIGRPSRDTAGAFTILPPALLLANAVIALGFTALAFERFAPLLCVTWLLGALVASLLPVPIGWLLAKKGKTKSTTLIRWHEFCTVILGVVWATFPALFFDAASTEVRLLAIAIVFAISGIGSLSLAQVQSSAVLFCALIAGSLSLASVKLGGEIGLALGAYSLIYSTAVALMILHAHDTARRRAAAEAEVKKQNEIISLLLNDFDKGATNWLFETDGAGRLTYVSKGLINGLSRTSNEILGRTLSEAACTTPDHAGWRELEAAFAAHRPIDGCRILLHFSGNPTWWRITAKPLQSADGAFGGYRGAAHDVTDDYLNEAKLAAAKEAAEKESASKSQILAVMSHELRTPLNTILGFAELLASSRSDTLPEDLRIEHLRTIVSSSRHLQVLINDILDVTRIEKGTLRLVEQESDAAELVEVSVKMCRGMAENAGITVIARITDGIEIKVDITRLKQVLINLVTNAIKFSEAGGTVNVGFEPQTDGGLAVFVRDSGIGIRKEDIERILEPYVQADHGTARRFGGIGLGLAIANKIALLHGGSISIESQFGLGTTARLILPASRVAWPRPGKIGAATAA